MIRFSGQNLTCIRAHSTVFKNLSFCIESGQALALTGANGSGKTSLLRVMAGLLAPERGALAWNDAAMPDDVIHWAGPDIALKTDLTVKENLEFWGLGADTDAALSRLNMGALADTPVRFLSFGQRRRASLCRLFLTPRPLWLLDEPETGLDAQNAQALRALVREHTHGGGMAVIATHRPELWGADVELEMKAAT